MKMMSQYLIGGVCLLALVVCLWRSDIQITWYSPLKMGLSVGEVHVGATQGGVTTEGCWSGHEGTTWSWCQVDFMKYVPPSQMLMHEKLMRPDKH